MADRWIVIPGWDKFQHPDVGRSNRRPRWIKNHLALLHKDEYLELTAHQRAVLHGLWMLYASKGRQVHVNTASLSRQLNLRVSSRQLESLRNAGFIDFLQADSKQEPRLEVEVEVEKAFKAFTSIEDPGNGEASGYQIPDLLKEI